MDEAVWHRAPGPSEDRGARIVDGRRARFDDEDEAVEDALRLAPAPPSPGLDIVPVPDERHDEERETPLDGRAPAAVPGPRILPSRRLLPPRPQQPHQPPAPIRRQQPVPQPALSEAEELANWLERDIGVALRRKWDLQTARAPEFGDGLILCLLADHLRQKTGKPQLAGVHREPKTAAARLQNIRRALEALREEPRIPVDHLWSDLAIRDGSTAVILPLLAQIRRAL
jgi:hypothetical protein